MPFPNPDTQFKKGQSGNPGGKSGDVIAAERRAAYNASLLRDDLLEAVRAEAEHLKAQVEAGEADRADLIKLLMNSDARGAMNDAQDREFGKPQQSTDHTSSDGSMSVSILRFSDTEEGDS